MYDYRSLRKKKRKKEYIYKEENVKLNIMNIFLLIKNYI